MKNIIELPISELKNALTGLGKVISKRTTLPVLEHLRVTRNQQGSVTLQATDLDVTVTYQIENPGIPCDFLVPFGPLNKLVKGSKEPVQLIVEAKDKVRLKAFIGTSPMEQTVDSLPVTEFPPVPKVDGGAIPVDATFRDTLRHAFDCCFGDSSRYVLQNVIVDVRDPKAHYLAATDGRHLFCANSFVFDGLKESVLIPDRPFLRWNKFMEEGSGELSVSKQKENTWLQLKSGPWTFIGKQCDAQFPNWKQVLPVKNKGGTCIQFNPAAVATLLDAVPRLPGGDDINRAVQLEVLGGVLLVKARAKEAKEWTRLTVEGVTITGKSVCVTLNRDYLLKALRFGLTTLEIVNELAPLDFTNAGRRMIVMPIRQSGPAESATTPPPSADSSVPTPQTTPPPSESNEAQPKETPAMPKNTETAPTETTAETSPVKVVVQHIENIKETLKGVLKEFSEVLDHLKQLEKDKKASDRDLETVREKLREIQSVRI